MLTLVRVATDIPRFWLSVTCFKLFVVFAPKDSSFYHIMHKHLVAAGKEMRANINARRIWGG